MCTFEIYITPKYTIMELARADHVRYVTFDRIHLFHSWIKHNFEEYFIDLDENAINREVYLNPDLFEISGENIVFIGNQRLLHLPPGSPSWETTRKLVNEFIKEYPPMFR